MTHFVSHLEGAIDGTRLAFGTVINMHAGRPVLVRYDLDRIRDSVSPAIIASRPPTMWRYRELLPLPMDCEPVSLGETMTPLMPCPRLGSELGLRKLLVKDESRLPTGSFKARGMAMAVSMAKWLGINRVALPTAGNAGGAAAAYAARAGMECFVFMPDDTPAANQFEASLYGAKAFAVNGLINDCGKIVRHGTETMGWFDLSTLKEPYRLEGKKTMGLELAEELGWRLPDWIFYPTGGGTGLIGMAKAFQELTALGWIAAKQIPKFVVCQAEGCAPIVNAFNKGKRFAEPIANAHTAASGLRVPAAVGDFLILDAVRQSGGTARIGSEGKIAAWMGRASAAEGLGICPETAVCFDVLEQMTQSGEVKPDDAVVVFNTGAATKYLESRPANLPRLDKAAIDWKKIG